MHLQVYLDTNVLLALLASETTVSDAMKKFLALCENGSIELLLPEQTELEFSSNREDVVAKTLQSLGEAKSLGGLPPLVKNHERYDEVCSLRRDLVSLIGSFEKSFKEAANSRTLPVDEWLSDLRKVARLIPTTPEVFTRAKQRAALHLPPGKGSSLGDRIVWECLLEAGEFFEDLHFVSTDNKDYRSPVNSGVIRDKLREEWDRRHMGSVELYGSLEIFLGSISKTDSFVKAAEIGRSIWALRTQSSDESIDLACSAIERYMKVLSLRQVRMIVRSAKLYFDRVFITSDVFDRMIVALGRNYGKLLCDEERKTVSEITAISCSPSSFAQATAKHTGSW